MTTRGGGGLGKSLANILADTHVKTRTALLNIEADHNDRVRTATWETMEREIADRIRNLGILPHDDELLSDTAKALMQVVVGPKNQTDLLLGAAAAIGVLFGGANAAASPWLQEIQQRTMDKQGRTVPAPDQAATLAATGFVDEGTAGQWAGWAGMHDGAWAAVRDSAHRELDVGTALDAVRREKLTSDALGLIFKRSGFRNEAIQVLEGLVYGPPSAEAAVSAAVQSQLSDRDARTILAANGIDPKHFEWLYGLNGNPPGTMEMLDLLNRELVDESTVVQAIRESRVKNKYIPYILQMRYSIPPQRTVVAMLRKGVIDTTQADKWLKADGFDPVARHALITEATSDRKEATKDLSRQQLTELYNLKIRSKEQTEASLLALGYDQSEVDALIAIEDLKIIRRRIDNAVTRVHSNYIAHKIDAATVNSALADLGLPPDAVTELLDIWDTERTINVRVLSEAQIVAATKKSVLTPDEALQRLITMNYSQADATILLATAGITTGG